MFKKLTFAISLSLSLPGTVFSLGLGEINIFSNLNEPLKAHIQVVDSKSVPMDEIIISHASAQIYQKANLPRPDALNNIHLEKTRLANGSVIIVLSTKQALREPFITFIAEMKWPAGQVNREYTFLLDPPEFVKQQSQPISQKKVAEPAAKASSEASERKKTRIRKKTRKTAVTTRPAVDYSAVIAAHKTDKTYTTRKADTLWKIAKRLKPDNSVTTYQTMQALFVLNPDAFINGNINLLKQNKILSIPSRDEILQINGKKPEQQPGVTHTSSTKPGKTDSIKTVKQTITTADSGTQDTSTEPQVSSSTQETQDTARLKIIPPTEDIINKPVQSREDLKLINKALKTSIDTIKLLKDENDQLAAQIEQLTEKLNNLDSQNSQLDSQISQINSYIKSGKAPVQPANTSDTTAPTTAAVEPIVEKDSVVTVESDTGAAMTKPRSFIREVLANPMITFALVIFALFILTAVILTISKQSDKRRQRKLADYHAHNFDQDTSVKQKAAPKPANNAPETEAKSRTSSDALTETLSDAEEELPAEQDTKKSDEEEMDFFEYFEKKINSPDSSENEELPEQASESSVDAGDDIDFSLNISDEEIEQYEKKISESYDKSKAPAEKDQFNEVNTYIAYGNYEKAEALILEALVDAPEEQSLHIKLMECYSLNNKRNEFMQHITSIVNLLHNDMVLRHRAETIYQQTWDDTLNIDKLG